MADVVVRHVRATEREDSRRRAMAVECEREDGERARCVHMHACVDAWRCACVRAHQIMAAEG